MRFPARLAVLVGVIGLAACGRIGYEERRQADAAVADVPALIDSRAIDAAVDAPSVCPADTLVTVVGGSACIEIAQRGTDTWINAKALCEGMGRRLCTDAEWLEGCTNQSTLTNMTGDDYEWVAEEAAGIAQKRGASGCDDSSSHAITDPYGYRCCVSLP